jgi:hypothetical protein
MKCILVFSRFLKRMSVIFSPGSGSPKRRRSWRKNLQMKRRKRKRRKRKRKMRMVEMKKNQMTMNR